LNHAKKKESEAKAEAKKQNISRKGAKFAKKYFGFALRILRLCGKIKI